MAQTAGLFSSTVIAYQGIRTLADTSLRSFGIHCATHQIRLILVSAVVITSLSYPALAIYSSTPSYSRLASTSNVVDSFLADYVAFGSDALRDLQNFWQGQSNIQILVDELIRARCGSDRTLRVERILIHSNTPDDAGALTNQTLLSALQLEHRVLERVRSQGVPCLEAGTNECVVFSPLAFWNHDEARLRSDTDILSALKNHDGVSVAGIPITPQMVLAGRTLDRSATNIDSATFLVHTFVFLESDCLNKASHDNWLDILKNLTQGNDAFTETIEPTLIALEYNHGLSKKQGFSTISSFVYLAYVVFFAYVRRSMKRMSGVHTRIGLTFTALFEIVASTITSLSVCSLMRFKVTMVPWSLLPIVIIFVGAENMFNLVDAVTKTSVTLPVKERIAEGLSRAGLSNTLKVVGYNCVLGTIARCSTGAISQFCTFAVVVLVAHWFLAHTFFLAVLSIDIQRLELEELISQNPSLTPVVASAQQENPPLAPASWQQRVAYQLKVMLKGRAITNISLLLLLATTATLYVLTRPSVYDDTNLGVTFSPSFPIFTKPPLNQTQDPSWWLWKALNPEDHPLVHLRVEVPTIVAFQPAGTVSQSVQQSLRPSTPTLDIMLWLLKILPVPMDAELLEDQRNRDDRKATSRRTVGDVIFSTLPRGLATDAELLAASKNGQAIAAVGLQNEVSFWHTKDTEPLVIRSSNSSATETVSALALDDRGDFLAFGTASGTVSVCAVSRKDVKHYKPLIPPDNISGVTELHFSRPSSITPKQKAGPSSRPREPPPILVCHGNGTIMQWNFVPHPCSYPIKPVSSSAVLRTNIISIQSTGCLLVAFSLDDGSVEVAELGHTPETSHIRCSLLAGNPVDPVAKVHACRVKVADNEQTIVGVASDAGVVSLWDAASSECLLVIDEPHGTVDQLRLSPIHLVTCHLCGEFPIDSLVATLSVGPAIIFYRAYFPSQSRHCSCPGSTPQAGAILTSGRRSQSSSVASPSPFSRRASSASTAPDFDTSFPVSGHGILPRRTSEKELLRRSCETLAPVDECEVGYALGPLDRSSARTDITLVKVAEATSERGGWDTVGGRVVGIRRISRSQVGNKAMASCPTSTIHSLGLTSAALDRWEFWSYELATSVFRGSAMSSLSADHRPPSSSSPSSPPSQNYPRLPFTRVVGFQVSNSLGVAGFGNTVGVLHFHDLAHCPG
ncbi:sterol-sensing domain of SREBP cleavage-activation-domain-containing protein [Boletus edulis BED1]|uniref:Sterol regulatory element-binding protein cleavage-activating protein n=1 Tax=Boletus edulis BED1 TaxID=1328754 RepID=A0AAD4GAM6_BOLED|nr:sterol-sensing domain of SREBP cleavage-activation-domain-containing protein [Boletus edulis BED1]